LRVLFVAIRILFFSYYSEPKIRIDSFEKNDFPFIEDFHVLEIFLFDVEGDRLARMEADKYEGKEWIKTVVLRERHGHSA
jgi:hypothetical protein